MHTHTDSYTQMRMLNHTPGPARPQTRALRTATQLHARVNPYKYSEPWSPTSAQHRCGPGRSTLPGRGGTPPAPHQPSWGPARTCPAHMGMLVRVGACACRWGRPCAGTSKGSSMGVAANRVWVRMRVRVRVHVCVWWDTHALGRHGVAA